MFKLKKTWLALLVLILGLYTNTKGETLPNEEYPPRQRPEPTRWVDPEGRRPTPFNKTRDYQVYISSLDKREPNETRLYPAPRSGSSNTDIYVVVDESIYSSITDSLNQYKTNLENSGFSVAIHLCSNCTPADVRSLLQQALPAGLMGAVLVGYIPSAWYETDCQWKPPPEPPEHEEFPIDLYYMDLDGNWTDADVDGLFDGHTGDVAPEIWVGRLRAPDWAVEVELLENYFDKNDKYRNGNFYGLPYRALVYIDDDWFDIYADIWDAAVGLVYDNRTLVKDKATTNAEDYLNRLSQNYEFNHVAVHSSAFAHRFKINDEYPNGWVHWHEIRDTDPHIYFHNLYACSAARYIEENYIGGWYIFADTYGLIAVGSTKTGAMYRLEEFYQPLSENKNIGEAFKEWFIDHGEDDRCSFYGLTILGDPTLKVLWPPYFNKDRFYVKDSIGRSVAFFGDKGDLVLKGTLQQRPNRPPTGHDEFRVQDSGGEEVAIIDATDGNMYIDGQLHEDQDMSQLSPEGFLIKNSSGDVVAYIDDSGDDSGHVYLKGKLYENSIP